MTDREPPRLADRLLEGLVPPGDFREALLGDLREEFGAERGVRFRATRYWLRVLRMAPRLWLDRAALRRISNPIGAGESMPRTFVTDVAFAVRLFRRRRSWAAVLLLTVALGIGAATSMFSVVDGVLIRPLPYPDPDRLVSVHRTVPEWRDDPLFSRSWERMPLTWLQYREWQDRQTAFEGVGAYLWTVRTLSGEVGAEQVDVLVVSASLLDVLGVTPRMGRPFDRAEEGWPGDRVALVSDAVWRGRFGGDAGVLGRTLELNDEAYRIVGVLPAGLRLPGLRVAPDYWIPAGTTPRDTLGVDMNYEAIGRLSASGTFASAEAETAHLFRFGGGPEQGGARLVGLREDATRSVRGPFLLLLTASGLLLLITCVNVAALLLGEGSRRRSEFASRLALGAGPGRLMRQLLTEQIVVSVAGALLGVVAAYWFTRGLVGLAPAGTPRIHEVAVDWRATLFAFAAALVTAVVFGLTPAISLVRESARTLIGSAARVSERRGVLHRVAIGVQVGLAVALLIGATLLVRSLSRLSSEPAGFSPARLVHVRPLFNPSYAGAAEQRQYFETVLEHVRGMPGVRSASASSSVPFTDGGAGTNVRADVGGVEHAGAAQVRVVMPDFLETLGVPILEGRDLDAGDDGGAARVAVINRALARQFWPDQPALGQRIAIDDVWREVVGVAGDVKHRSLAGDAPATLYLPAAQSNRRGFGLILRVDGDPAGAIDATVARMREVDASVAIARTETIDALIERTLAPQRFRTTITAFFALVALLLTAAGLYGVTADSVSRRLREMAIRVALGATRIAVVRLAVLGTVALASAGAAGGVLLALAANRAISPWLYDIPSTDIGTYGLVAAGTLLVTAVAAWIPARRAGRADAAELLRSD